MVWLRFLSLSFGNTTYAAATLLAVFLGGLALGAVLFGRFTDRLRRPLTAFALVEIAVALIAVASPHGFGLIDAAYVHLYRVLGNQPALFAAGRALLAAAILLPPTVLMGGTLPLILRAAVPASAVPASTGAATGSAGAPRRGRQGIGRASALFYAVNTLGATAGVALAGIFTIRLAGLTATLTLAAGLDLVAGLGCALLSRPMEPAAGSGREPEPAAGPGAGEEPDTEPLLPRGRSRAAMAGPRAAARQLRPAARAAPAVPARRVARRAAARRARAGAERWTEYGERMAIHRDYLRDQLAAQRGGGSTR